MSSVFSRKNFQQHDYMFWEHGGNAAIRKGDWKAIHSLNGNTWALYDLSKDRSEEQELSALFPALRKDLKEKWEGSAKENFVLLKKLNNN